MFHSRKLVALAATVVLLGANPSDVGATPAEVATTVAEAATDGTVVTWEDVWRAAQAHPALLAASSEVDEASGAVRASRQYPNPTIGLGLGRAEAIDGVEEADIWDVDVKVPLLLWGAYRGGTKVARAEHAAAAHELARVRLEVFRELKAMFLRVAHDQARLSALDASAEQLAELVDVAGKRVDMGEARPMELSRLEIEFARMSLLLSEARETAGARRQILNIWAGSSLPQNFHVKADLSALPPLPPAEDAVASAIAVNPQVGFAGERLNAATARLGAERGARFPTIELGGFYEKELDARNYGASLELSLPLWNWNSGGISQARAAEATARYDRDVTLTAIEVAARESHAAAVSAYGRARGFREVILPKAVEVAGSMERMYQIGVVDIMNVLDARRTLIEIESDSLEAYLSSQLAYLRLATLMGETKDD
jgi:cobalt-zinc-cadmium efflux system outer membrane protein